MEIRRNKARSISRLFLQHLIALGAAILSFLVLLIVAASLFLQSGILLPANFSDVQLNQIEDSLREKFDESMLPPYCSYLLLSEDGTVITASMSERDIHETRTFLRSGERKYYEFYKVISQQNHQLLIVKYDILTHFTNPVLHKIIPYPEFFVLFLLIGFIVLSVGITASRFGRKLKRSLTPIIAATEKIKEQDLTFEITPTKIAEFNSILDAIDSLRLALSASLKEQWEKEQEKTFQLSALTHDIKTPLTVIKGNTELLEESASSPEEKELLSYIKSGSDTIENYLDLLIQTLNSEILPIAKTKVNLHDFLRVVCAEGEKICKPKKMVFRLINDSKCCTIDADCELLKRSILNIMDNAVRYSDAGASIELHVRESETVVCFCVVDFGAGFSEEILEKADQRFFTEDRSRANHHYGLGLSFAKAAAKMHGGSLTIKNNTETAGASVCIEIAK